MTTKFLVVIEKGKNNYSAYSPDVSGCAATGKTVEETLTNIKEALEFHLEGVSENGEPMPTPKNLNYYIENTDEISSEDILTHIDVTISEPVLI
jgi:predicted RNase H-like HicB family nuclease